MIKSVVTSYVLEEWQALYRPKDLITDSGRKHRPEEWEGGTLTLFMSMRFSNEGDFHTIFMALDKDLSAPPGKVPPPLPHSSLSKLTSVVSCQKYL